MGTLASVKFTFLQLTHAKQQTCDSYKIISVHDFILPLITVSQAQNVSKVLSSDYMSSLEMALTSIRF